MPNIPSFTAAENLNRVLMDKHNHYFIVEGPFDMPIYSEVIDVLIYKHNISKDFVTIFGGGKNNIIAWINNETPQNARVVLDMDFDNFTTELIYDIVTPLKRYSIENYFFEKEVISPLIAHMLTRNKADVDNSFSLNQLIENWSEELKELLPVLFYYQKIYAGDKNKWTSIFINKGQGDWKLCPERINVIKLELLQEMGRDLATCNNEFNVAFKNGWCPIINFPGKILLESMNRYLKRYCNGEKQYSYAPVTSVKSLIFQLASRLIKNEELEGILLEAIS